MPPPPPATGIPTATQAAPVPAAAILRASPKPAENTTNFFNRDLSWLDFNRRVLHEAIDPRTPLLERIKFLAIYSSNSDEFFMKRVGLLKRKIANHSLERSHDNLSAEDHYHAVRERIRTLTAEVIDLWSNHLRPALEAESIFIKDYVELSPNQRAKADDYFKSHIFPVLTPLAVDPGHPFPFISNQSLSIGVLVRPHGSTSSGGGGDSAFARIKVPQLLSRWLTFQDGRSYTFVPIESLIEGRLESLFPGMEIIEAQHFRVTRSAEVEPDIDDPEDLLEVVQEELRARRFADTVRVQITANMSAAMRLALLEGLEVADDSMYELPEPLGKSDLMSLALTVDRPDLKYPPFKPEVTPAFADPDADVFAIIRQSDVLVHHPYESFESSVEKFILQAVKDPKVLAIKMTLYRTSGDSPFVPALARAAEAGKQVAVLVELKARFDEERNIRWAQTLEEAGAHVVYGVLGLKTHTKTALVVRREDSPGSPGGGGGLKCYVHVATGNYNSKTAQTYTDLGLFTCRDDITNDVVDLFAYLTGRSLKRDYKKLLVAPGTMRAGFLAMIEREAACAAAGKPSRIIAKMNALEDTDIINALYKASQAGVPIDLIVRGFCCLRPGIPGLSDNIRVSSVIGRFLEHSRVFYFQNGNANTDSANPPSPGIAIPGSTPSTPSAALPPATTEAFYLSSADWMSRNLSHRVEAAVPVEDPTLRLRLKELLDILLTDTRQAWDLHPDGSWTQRTPPKETPNPGTHLRLIDLTKHRHI